MCCRRRGAALMRGRVRSRLASRFAASRWIRAFGASRTRGCFLFHACVGLSFGDQFVSRSIAVRIGSATGAQSARPHTRPACRSTGYTGSRSTPSPRPPSCLPRRPRASPARWRPRIHPAAVGQQLGIAQQTLAHYEGGRLRLPVSLLPELTRTLGLSADELVGQSTTRHSRRGPTSKLQQQIEAISQLPKARQRFVSEILDTVLAQTQQ